MDDPAQPILRSDVVVKTTIVGDVDDRRVNPDPGTPHRWGQAAMAGSTSGSRPCPAPINNTITATAINSIPETMNASK
jgi:hypothetical protein